MTTDEFAKTANALLAEGIVLLRAHAGEGDVINRYVATVETVRAQYRAAKEAPAPAPLFTAESEARLAAEAEEERRRNPEPAWCKEFDARHAIPAPAPAPSAPPAGAPVCKAWCGKTSDSYIPAERPCAGDPSCVGGPTHGGCYCSGECVNAGRPISPPPAPTTCEPWCGLRYHRDEVPTEHDGMNVLDCLSSADAPGEGVHSFCTQACRAAMRPLNPPPSTPVTVATRERPTHCQCPYHECAGKLENPDHELCEKCYRKRGDECVAVATGGVPTGFPTGGVPTGFRLGDGWTIRKNGDFWCSHDGRTCGGVGPFKHYETHRGACAAHAAELGALVPIDTARPGPAHPATGTTCTRCGQVIQSVPFAFPPVATVDGWRHERCPEVPPGPVPVEAPLLSKDGDKCPFCDRRAPHRHDFVDQASPPGTPASEPAVRPLLSDVLHEACAVPTEWAERAAALETELAATARDKERERCMAWWEWFWGDTIGRNIKTETGIRSGEDAPGAVTPETGGAR